MKVYLGDSVYAEIIDGQIKLTTEDGEMQTNAIYLERVVYDALEQFASKNKESF